jgi:predicted metal-dependent hydrolase
MSPRVDPSSTAGQPSALEAACHQPLPALVREGIDRFNRKAFFEAHESLETAWRAEPGKVRDLYHGVLQLAVAWHHVERGSYSGALHSLARAQHWRAGFPRECQGLKVDSIRAQVEALRAEVVRHGAGGLAAVDRGLHRPISPAHDNAAPSM